MTAHDPEPVAMRRLHALTVLFAGMAIARGFIIPAIVAGITMARRNPGGAIAWSVLIGGVVSVLGGTAKYLTFHYRLTTDSLIIDSGVLHKQHRVIPLTSVQNVEIRETAVQRALGVASLAVETATGGQEADATFMVLGREAAEGLRDSLLAHRVRVVPNEEERVATADPHTVPGTVITRLAPRDLIIAGATANNAGLIVAGLLGAIQFLDDLPYLGWVKRLVDRLTFDGFESAFLVGLGAVAALLLGGWILSIAGSVVGYYDFTLTRHDNQLHKSQGLVARYRTTIPLARVQAMRVEESVLRRPLALAALRVTTAGAAQSQDTEGAQTVAPITRTAEIPRLVTAIFPSLSYSDIALTPVHLRSRSRAFSQYLLALLALAVAIAMWRPQLALVPLLLILPAWLVAAWQYRHRGFATVPGYVIARNGAVNQITWLLPSHNIQALHMLESPFQRRHGLASVVLDTAGGGGHASVRDLARADAIRLIDSLRE